MKRERVTAIKPRDSFVFYRSFLDALIGLDTDTQNEFFMAIAQYGLNGILPNFVGLKQALWAQIKYSLDKNITRYENCVRNGALGGAPKGNNHNPKGRNQYSEVNQEVNQEVNLNDNVNVYVDVNDNVDDKDKIKPKKAFIPPSLEDVQAYVMEKGYNMDAAAFCDYYASNGWKVGRNAMRDWRAAVNSWNRRQGNFDKVSGSKSCEARPAKEQRDFEFANHITNKLKGATDEALLW